jgi:dimethylaniline monooxygenase (N-oxide forming)
MRSKFCEPQVHPWSGAIAMPSIDEMRHGIAEFRASGANMRTTKMNLVALSFARAAGVEPDLDRWPELRRALWFGPLSPVSFRLQGRDALPDAATRFEAEARAFGGGQPTHFLPREADDLRRLARVSRDPALLSALASLPDR